MSSLSVSWRERRRGLDLCFEFGDRARALHAQQVAAVNLSDDFEEESELFVLRYQTSVAYCLAFKALSTPTKDQLAFIQVMRKFGSSLRYVVSHSMSRAGIIELSTIKNIPSSALMMANIAAGPADDMPGYYKVVKNRFGVTGKNYTLDALTHRLRNPAAVIEV